MSFHVIYFSNHGTAKNTEFHLISWCENFVERHSFRIVSGESPENVRQLCLFTEFPHQDDMWNYGIFTVWPLGFNISQKLFSRFSHESYKWLDLFSCVTTGNNENCYPKNILFLPLVKLWLLQMFLTCFVKNYTLFFISNTVITKARLTLAKNQANTEQHPETEVLLFEYYLQSSSTLSCKCNRTYPKNKQ